MKQIWPLLCLVLLLTPYRSEAKGIDLSVSGLLKIAVAAEDQDRRKHRRDDNEDVPPPQNNRNDKGERRDDRIKIAMDIARSRGHVLDAGPQGGSIFWVRVATERGRVDLLVDVDSGRIIGER